MCLTLGLMVKYDLIFYKTTLSSIALPGQQLDTKKDVLSCDRFPGIYQRNGYFRFFLESILVIKQNTRLLVVQLALA